MKINKDQAFLSRRRKLRFDYRRGSGHLAAYLANRLRWHYYPRLRHVSSFPDHVDVEISSACNMRCPMCYTITEEFKQKVKRQLMDPDLFRKIIDECADHGTFSIRISLRGEPFLHPQVIDMIAYAKRKGIKEVSSLTNNLALTPELFEAAMHAGLDWLTISFDGLGGTYESIRRPASFAESFDKVKTYERIKAKQGSRKPVIKVQTVWPAIKDDPEPYFRAFEPYVDDIAINPLVDYLHKDKDGDIVYEEGFDCPVLYQRLVIGSDGVILLCSNDEFCLHPLGDANSDSLQDVWRGEKLSEARRIHRSGRGVELLEPCRRCYLPRKTEASMERIGAQDVAIEKLLHRPDEVGR